MSSALKAALAGKGFDGGDFNGQDRDHFERALRWVEKEQHKRTRTKESSFRPYITPIWDHEAQVYYSESNIRGLHIEAETLEEFEVVAMEMAQIPVNPPQAI
jgi:hypothetical protein